MRRGLTCHGKWLQLVLLRGFFCSFFLLCAVAQVNAVECTVGGGTYIIGAEMVADECIPEGMNDDTPIHSQIRSIICDNGEVVVMPGSTVSEGNATPNQIISSLKSYPYKVYRNVEGSHIVGVHRYYFGTIDGRPMGGYSTGTVTTGLFEAGFILPDAPTCRGGDYNSCSNEIPVGSSVNQGSGRYSHTQKLFTTGGTQPLSLDVDLFYRSFPQFPGAIGSGWSHSYEIMLAPGPGNSRVFWQFGKRRVYEFYTSGYVAPRGDYSALVENADGSLTLTEENGLVRDFAADGRILAMTDRNGNSLTFSYADGQLTSVTDANGRILTLTYDENGKLQAFADPIGHIYGLDYTDGLLTGVRYPDGAVWEYAYNSNNLLISKTDPNGNLTQYDFDTDGRVIQVIDPQNNSRSFTHAVSAPVGRVPEAFPASVVPDRDFVLSEQSGGEWGFQFDPSHEKVTRKTGPLGHETVYDYDALGQLINKVEPDIGTTSYVYDNGGHVVSMIDPLGQLTEWTYNSFGQVLTVGGAPGDYSFTYDVGGNLLTRTKPAGETTTFAYDNAGNLVAIIDPLGRVTSLTYDSANNPVTLTRSTGAQYTMTYDANGNLLTLRDPLGRVTNMVYDSRNQLQQITAAGGQVTRFSYDGNGNRTSVVDANGHETRFSYNHQQQLTSFLDALDHQTLLAYEVPGCPSCGGISPLSSVTAANGGQTAFAYDLLGRLISTTDPLGMVETLSYAATRNPVSKTAADGSSVAYSYDALQRLTGKTLSTGDSISYVYDSRNNVTSAANEQNSYAFTYDEANRLILVSDSRGVSIAYQYDAAGNRTALTLQPGAENEQTIAYAYDEGDRPTGMLTSEGSFSFSYDLADRPATLSYPNGIVAHYNYDDINQSDWLIGIDYADSTIGEDLLAIAYPQHDALGQRLQSTTDGITTSYGYDAAGRVTRAQTGSSVEAYSYDEVGNRIAGPTVKDTADTAYEHNLANQMIEGRKFAYQYDARGNQLYRVLNSIGTKHWVYTWNAENQLTQADMINDGQIIREVSFQYDAFGRRITKQIVQNGRTLTTSYFYDEEDIILQVTDDGADTTTTWYVHGPGIDEPLAMIEDETPYFYHADDLGSIAALTDVDGQIVQRYSYNAFGMLTRVQNPEFKNSYAFTGREWDKELGLYYYRARYYDPMEGRFISQDPIGFARGDVNLYGYVENNPVNWVDPWGLFQFGTRPLQGFPMSMSLGNSNLSLTHENGFYDDGRNVGYFPTGIGSDDPSQLGNYKKFGPFYEDSLMSVAENNIKNSGTFLPDDPNESWYSNSNPYDYDLTSHNCQDFSDALRAEYKKLGGHICPTPFVRGLCSSIR